MFARPSGPRMNLFLLVIFILTIIFSISTLVYERQDRPFSCRTWAECGYLERPTYNHDIPADLDAVVDQGTSHDGTVFYTHEILNLPRPELLVLVVSKDSASWGAVGQTLSWSSGRTPADLIDLLIRTDLDFTRVSIGLLTTQQDEFDTLKNATRALPFARTSILLQPPHASEQYDRANHDDNTNKDDNNDDRADQQRRANIARARNYLMLRTVQDEPHLLWIDADIVELSDGLVQRMMDQAGKNPHVGLMTARCRLAAKDSDYDTKAWSLSSPGSGEQSSETDDKAEKQEKNTNPAAAAGGPDEIITGAVPLSAQSSAATSLRTLRTQAGTLLRGTSDDTLIPLDSVGATILYIRSDLVLRGVVFPPFNVVGTLWDHAGWTGMETEGICYMAQQVAGKRCYLLGGDNYVRHAEFGIGAKGS